LPTNTSDIAHLLRRTGFGAPPPLVAELARLSLPEAVDRVLDFSTNPTDNIAWPASSNWENWIYLRRWWMHRMATVPSPLQEKLTFFWHGHFATSYWKVNDLKVMHKQNQVLRKNAFGDFEVLAQQVSLDPAMLLYLDNHDNFKTAPNENFARELMELFMLGADQGYTQFDVVEMARAWTGHSINWTPSGANGYLFRDSAHDYTAKTLFGISKNWNGPDTITEMVRGSRATICAQFIARKLWSFFAMPTNDPYLIVSLGSDMLAANWNIGAFLRRIFTRSEFYSDQVKSGLVRCPIDWATSLMRACGVSPFEVDIDNRMVDIGQAVFEPPNVSGWKHNEVWITETGSWIKEDIAANIARVATDKGFLNPIVAMDNAQAVEHVLQSLWIDRASAKTQRSLTTWLEAERRAGGDRQRYNMVRIVSLTPEFQLA
jgi:uncharacterized protein (DUF1800 family)